MTIYIYNDDGASEECVQGLLTQLHEKKVSVISGAQLQQDKWMSDARLLIMPGGRSLPFYKKLDQKGNQQIKTFVEQGGFYLGICAGAYYACKKTIFAKNKPLELILPGELNFFEGNGIGPIFGADDFAYQSEKGARVVDIIFDNQETDSAYFNGGCYFENADESKNVRVLARYQCNQQPAIIACNVGLGQALLSGVHPELSVKGEITANRIKLFWRLNLC